MEQTSQLNSRRRRPGESAQAYHAFCLYLDIEGRRSIRLAYSILTGKNETPAPGHWNGWCTDHKWIARATAYDAEVEKIERDELARQIRKMAIIRAQFELDRLHKNIRRTNNTDLVLDKLESAPADDVIQEKSETVNGKKTTTITKVKGLNASGYAAVLKEQRENERHVILGVRDHKPSEDKVVGLLWRGAPPNESAGRKTRPPDPEFLHPA